MHSDRLRTGSVLGMTGAAYAIVLDCRPWIKLRLLEMPIDPDKAVKVLTFDSRSKILMNLPNMPDLAMPDALRHAASHTGKTKPELREERE